MSYRKAVAVWGLAWCLIFGGAALPAAFGQDAPDVINLVTGTDYEPYTDPKLPQGGMATELVVRAFEADGKDVKLTYHPWKRGYKLALAGRYDGTFPYVRTPERQQDYAYSDNLIATNVTGFVRKGSGLGGQPLAVIRGRTICRPTGYFIPTAILTHIEAADTEHLQAVDMKSCFRHLVAGRTDVVISGLIQGLLDLQEVVKQHPALLQRSGLDGSKDFARLAWEEGDGGLHLIVPRAHSQRGVILASFNRGIAKLRADGTFDAIVNRHLDEMGLVLN